MKIYAKGGLTDSVPTVVVDVVVVDGQVVAVVVRVEAVSDVVVHHVVAEVTSLVAVGVLAEVVVVDARPQDVAGNLDFVEHLRVGVVLAVPANLVGDSVAFRIVPSEVYKTKSDQGKRKKKRGRIQSEEVRYGKNASWKWWDDTAGQEKNK